MAVAVLIVPNIVMDSVQFVRRGAPLATARRLARPLPFGARGTVLGTRLLVGLSSRTATLLLGGFICLFVVLNSTRFSLRVPPGWEPWLSPAVGLIAGVVGGITNTPGTPLVIYFYALGMTKHDFVASIAFTFIVYKLVQLGAVFGYTCFIDVSGRGLGRPGQNSRMGKSYDTFGPMGPCIATADEIPEPNRLGVRLWVGEALRQDYSTSDMEYDVPEVLAYASGFMTLLPGDVIACGTNHQGLGPLQDGDTATMEIEQIGRFSVRVSDPLKRQWPRQIDREMAQRVRGG